MNFIFCYLLLLICFSDRLLLISLNVILPKNAPATAGINAIMLHITNSSGKRLCEVGSMKIRS